MLICSSGRRPIFERNAFNLKSSGSVDRTHSSTPRSPASCFSNEMFASSPTANTYVRACVLLAYHSEIFALRISAASCRTAIRQQNDVTVRRVSPDGTAAVNAVCKSVPPRSRLPRTNSSALSTDIRTGGLRRERRNFRIEQQQVGIGPPGADSAAASPAPHSSVPTFPIAWTMTYRRAPRSSAGLRSLTAPVSPIRADASKNPGSAALSRYASTASVSCFAGSRP